MTKYNNLIIILFCFCSLAFASDEGSLKIKSNQTDAGIYINGQLKGKTGQNVRKGVIIKLEPGKYTVEIIKESGGPDDFYGKKEVTLKKKARKSLFIKAKERPSENFKNSLLKRYKKGIPSVEMVKIPAGSFTMGCITNVRCQYQEFPTHQVHLNTFMMATHEVTFEQWDTCVVLGNCKHRPKDKNFGRQQHPVINISWDDTQQFINWLNSATNENYRLPSEAEWEYAARAGTNTLFYTGQCLDTEHENYNGQNPTRGCNKQNQLKKTLPVGTLKPNPWGLYDMLGNVKEWTQDCLSDNYKKTPVDGSAHKAGSCTSRMIRGGAWDKGATISRSAKRNSNPPYVRFAGLGFRLVK